MLVTQDTDLVAEAKSGSMDAFDRLMIRYQRLVFKIAFGFCSERELALDLTQDIFMKIFKKLDSLRDARQFKAWLIRITYNECIAYQRKQKPYRETELIEEELAPGVLEETPQEMGVIRGEGRQRLQRLLAGLNPKHRLAVVLKYIEGASLVEIAEVLHTSEAVVKNMLHRSMRRLAMRAGGREVGFGG